MWGNTQVGALQHHQDVIPMVVDAWLDEGHPIPEDVQMSYMTLL
jgi:hypothetical protein